MKLTRSDVIDLATVVVIALFLVLAIQLVSILGGGCT